MEPTMSKILKHTALVTAIAAATAYANTVLAAVENNQSDRVTLPTIVITASKSAEEIQDVPARINVIDQQTIEQSPITQLSSLLKQDAASNVVQSGGYGQVSSIFLRGTNSKHTLVLRDGVKLNTATTSASSLAFIDTTDIKQIEILKGPASVLYGTDAIGGVVQLISKTPEKNSAFITGEIGENNTYKAVIGADFAENGYYAQVRGQRLETDGTPTSNAKDTVDAAFDQKGYSTKFGVEQDQYALSIDYNENEGNSEYDNYGMPAAQKFKNQLINLKGRVNLSDSLTVNARLSEFKDDIVQKKSKDFVKSKTQEAELYGQWHFTPSQNILFGSTYQNIKGNVISYNSPYNGSIDSVGYYLQHQYNDNKWNTQVGIRVEDNNKYGTHTLGQAAVRYHILPTTSVYANIGSAFRSPNLNELYSSSGNPDLNPEESVSYEIGVDQKIFEDIDVGLSVYQIKIDDLIDYNVNNNYKMGNIGKAKIQGAESYISWQQDQWFTKLSYNYVKSQDDSLKTDLQRRPRQSFTLTSGLTNEVYGISASLSAKSRAKEYQGTTPGYMSIDLNAFWNVTPNIKVFSNIENVGDVKYATAWYDADNHYINGGRLASAGVTFKY